MTFFPQKGHTFISRHFLKSFPINFLSRRNAENHIAQKLKKKKFADISVSTATEGGIYFSFNDLLMIMFVEVFVYLNISMFTGFVS